MDNCLALGWWQPQHALLQGTHLYLQKNRLANSISSWNQSLSHTVTCPPAALPSWLPFSRKSIRKQFCGVSTVTTVLEERLWKQNYGKHMSAFWNISLTLRLSNKWSTGSQHCTQYWNGPVASLSNAIRDQQSKRQNERHAPAGCMAAQCATSKKAQMKFVQRMKKTMTCF